MARKIIDNPSEDSLWKKVSRDGNLSWEEFENSAVFFMIAGVETTSSTLCYLLQSLTKNPDVKRKMKQEIDDVLQGRLPTYNDLKNLKYLEKVILETLHQHPILILMSRTGIEDQIVGEYLIPKGFHLFWSPAYIVNHHPAWSEFEDPDSFNPERFTDENTEKLTKIVHAGFGMGPHTCIGRHLAILELKIQIAYLIQNGDIETDTKKCTWNPHYPANSPQITAVKRTIQSF